MLDADLKQQLKNLFTPIQDRIGLSYTSCQHADQTQLIELLHDLSEATDKIYLHEDKTQVSAFPTFIIIKNDLSTGIEFRGIPNGHEFSSLVLAILHAGGQGRAFDESLKCRIQNLNGPIHIQTYISLTCENCPDVVQTLNQMALIHGNFTHTMVDGAYVPDEIQKLGIQGVPSVTANGKLIHSGKISVVDLLVKLENTFGTIKTQSQAIDLGILDVAIIGGGPAGASAAIYSARKGLKTMIIADKIGGQVQETKGIENLVSVLYTEGPQLAAQLQQHILNYPVQLLEHRRVKSINTDELTTTRLKKITLESGEYLHAKSVIIATGAKWRELGIPGEKDYLGRGVAFCPHCDGPFYKGKKVAVIGGGNSGVEAAIDLAGITKEVVLIEYGDQLKADLVLVNKLRSLPNASIVTQARTKEIIGDGKKVKQLIYVDRKTDQDIAIDLDGVFVQIGLLPNSGFLKDTVNLTKTGEIIVDEKGRTNVPGIYAAGDVTTAPYKQIIIAMGEGAKVALAAFEDAMHAA